MNLLGVESWPIVALCVIAVSMSLWVLGLVIKDAKKGSVLELFAAVFAAIGLLFIRKKRGRRG